MTNNISRGQLRPIESLQSKFRGKSTKIWQSKSSLLSDVHPRSRHLLDRSLKAWIETTTCRDRLNSITLSPMTTNICAGQLSPIKISVWCHRISSLYSTTQPTSRPDTVRAQERLTFRESSTRRIMMTTTKSWRCMTSHFAISLIL